MILRTDENEVALVDTERKRVRWHDEAQWFDFEKGFCKMNQPAMFVRAGSTLATFGNVVEIDHRVPACELVLR